MKTKKISIIVPMYNVEDYIEQTIHSLLNQTHQNIEIILVDDASTDRTTEISSLYAAKYKNIVLSKQLENKGVSAARNIGLKLAKGDYISFVDSDDILTPDALEIMYQISVKNDGDLIIGHYETFTTTNLISQNYNNDFSNPPQEYQLFVDKNPELFSHVYSWGKLYKRELIENFFFPEHLPYAEDQPFTIYTYLNAKKIYIVPYTTYYYRAREYQMTQVSLKEPIIYLRYLLESFEISKNYFEANIPDKTNNGFIAYTKKVIEESMRHIFEGAIYLHNSETHQEILLMLLNWINSLDDSLLLKSSSFQRTFIDSGQKYLSQLDTNSAHTYITLVKVIRNKMLNSSLKNEEEKRMLTAEQNTILDTALMKLDAFLTKNHLITDLNHSICYPKVTFLDLPNNSAKMQFQLIQQGQVSLYELSLNKKDTQWVLEKIDFREKIDYPEIHIKNSRPKILLTYRNFSGCNTLALYKSIPIQMKDYFDIDFISADINIEEYTQKILESDIVVTTNMEYRFNKKSFNPNQIVIDLWHGFPLKKMFYEDHSYHNKNSLEPYWSQFNYMTSYSSLYNQLIHKCMRVNPNSFVITGSPRNDLLFNKNSREILCDILEKKDRGQKFILYMPTFRSTDQNETTHTYSQLFDFKDFSFENLTTFLKENNYELIVKPHPIFGREYKEILKDNAHISLFPSERLETKMIDLYEILGAIDILITDYSSIYFDYLLLDKPIIFTPTDLANYSIERGFLLSPYEKWTPGPKVSSQQELLDEIINYSQDNEYFRNMRKVIKNKVHFYKDNNSSERVWNFISNLNNLS
ncbi:bifunctional glycosyltransferase/CDP-glycerol:glycerophosphate glycerophosphotransferase [Bacillus wiedmannii]|uniref:bifunctional glycosyltransferase/CDP-glycerol:glycerophosphate glycerophosphotransferase n=1 Tax=Bacillus wiedmannii TaxID=1890302 RepID=UPI003CF48C4B